ncbi:MAG TPA: T9SS type A sorting domain-containing protein [Arachidicoccus sp.]|nr:T9SS type A sorting domain-containing protein [Arachidicoccus sp.]
MKRFLLSAIVVTAMVIGNIQFSHAQTVIQNWATLASDANPQAVVIDASGNIYTANYSNSTISKIIPDGTVTQVWGALANNSGPINLAIDIQGNLYTANYLNFTISKIAPSGALTPIWAALGSPQQPHGIVVAPSGNVYTVNYGTNVVSRISARGGVTSVWASLLEHSNPISIVSDAFGNLYTANSSNNSVSKITSGGVVTQLATFGFLTTPIDITIDASGNLYTANLGSSSVSKITPDGIVTESWATLASGTGPVSIIVDASGNVYTANRNSTISKITSDGTVTQSWATLADNASPNDIAMDALGNIYTVNGGNNTVSKIEPGVPLPTVVKIFTGVLQNGIAILSWQSGVEANFSHYELEKSTEGQSFTFLDKVEAKGSNQTYDYSTSQSEPTGYYRLKMIDRDGHSKLSAVVIMSQKDVAYNNIIVYPVPSRNNIIIRTSRSGRLCIYNMTGQLVKVLDLKEGLNHIAINALSAGTYIGKINGQTVKFIKE